MSLHGVTIQKNLRIYIWAYTTSQHRRKLASAYESTRRHNPEECRYVPMSLHDVSIQKNLGIYLRVYTASQPRRM
jgi:hypothetical protein